MASFNIVLSVSASTGVAAEIALVEALDQAGEALAPLMRHNDYMAILSTLAKLRTAVDSFFDNVLVMSEDPALRGNRIAILNQLAGYFLSTADISVLQQP